MGTESVQVCAQTLGLSLEESRALFIKTLQGHTELLQNGQFVWSASYRRELWALTNRILVDDSTLKRQLTDPLTIFGSDSLLSGMLTAANQRDRKTFDRFHHQSLAVVNDRINKAIDPGPAKAMRQLLVRRESPGRDTYSLANSRLSGGAIMKRTTPEYQQTFAPDRLGYLGAYGISERAADRCYDMCKAVASYLTHRNGIRNCRRGTKPRGFGEVYKDPVVHLPPPIYTRVRFASHLRRAQESTRIAVNQNWVVCAGVIAGCCVGTRIPPHPPTSAATPDHYILIFGADAASYPVPHVEFVYWDPDPDGVHVDKNKFGRLFFVSKEHIADESRQY